MFLPCCFLLKWSKLSSNVSQPSQLEDGVRTGCKSESMQNTHLQLPGEFPSTSCVALAECKSSCQQSWFVKWAGWGSDLRWWWWGTHWLAGDWSHGIPALGANHHLAAMFLPGLKSAIWDKIGMNKRRALMTSHTGFQKHPFFLCFSPVEEMRLPWPKGQEVPPHSCSRPYQKLPFGDLNGF